MKKLFLKISIFTFVITALLSCDEDKVVYNGKDTDALAAFVDKRLPLEVIENVNESYSKILVEVSDLSDVDRNIVVSIAPESTALPSQYSIDQASLVIPANTYLGEIIVRGNFDNMEFDDAKKIFVKLVSVGNAHVSPEIIQVDVLKPTCPFYGGATVNATTYTASSFIDGGLVLNYTPVITQSPTNKRLFVINSLWGPNFVAAATGDTSYNGEFLYAGTITVNGDFSLTIETDFAYGRNAKGTFDPCNNSFNYTLSQNLFAGEDETFEDTFTVDVSWVPNN